METIRKINPGEQLPTWFEKRRWKNADTNKYLDKIEDYLVIEVDKKIVGSAQITFSKHTNCYHLASLWVDESSRGMKLGQKIINKLLSQSKASKVYMDTSKKDLVPYYAKCGFKLIKNPPKKFEEELLIRHPNKDMAEQNFMVCHLAI